MLTGEHQEGRGGPQHPLAECEQNRARDFQTSRPSGPCIPLQLGLGERAQPFGSWGRDTGDMRPPSSRGATATPRGTSTRALLCCLGKELRAGAGASRRVGLCLLHCHEFCETIAQGHVGCTGILGGKSQNESHWSCSLHSHSQLYMTEKTCFVRVMDLFNQGSLTCSDITGIGFLSVVRPNIFSC